MNKQALPDSDLCAWVKLLQWCGKVNERVTAEREGRAPQRGWWDLPIAEAQQ
jgi:hypothetical protein